MKARTLLSLDDGRLDLREVGPHSLLLERNNLVLFGQRLLNLLRCLLLALSLLLVFHLRTQTRHSVTSQQAGEM